MPSCDSASCASFRCGAKSAFADRVEHRVVGSLGCGHAHAERDPPGDLAHHRLDAAERVEVGARELCPGGLVAAADVVADTRRRHVALVGDPAADRLAVARVVVGAEHAELGVTGGHAALELLEAARVDIAEGLDRAHRLPPFSSRSWMKPAAAPRPGLLGRGASARLREAGAHQPQASR